jgi:hypothetical protein
MSRVSAVKTFVVRLTDGTDQLLNADSPEAAATLAAMALSEPGDHRLVIFDHDLNRTELVVCVAPPHASLCRAAYTLKRTCSTSPSSTR